MKVPSTLLLGLLWLSACQLPPSASPNTTSPGTSNQVITLPASMFVAELAGNNETPAVSSPASGYGVFLLNPAKDTLTIKVTVAGLTGPITGSHLHLGQSGKSGEVIKNLTVNGNLITGAWKKTDTDQPLTEERLKSLANGEIYVNVHTEKNPSGELRGQLSLSKDTVYPVLLSGAGEVPPATGKATGVAWIRVSADRSELTLKGNVFDLSGAATAAHLHKGDKTTAKGEVLKDVPVSGSGLSLSWKKADASAPLTPGILDLLLKGQIYLNVHTAASPEGEIRGQIE